MNEICEDLLDNVPEVVAAWEELLQQQPWFLKPPGERDDSLPAVVLSLVNAALCEPTSEAAHRRKVRAAAELGWRRRIDGLPEHVMFTEFHVLRQAIWYYLERKYGPSEAVSQAIFRVDAALTLATNASMWGYHRAEIEAMGKWEEGITRIVQSSPFLKRAARQGDGSNVPSSAQPNPPAISTGGSGGKELASPRSGQQRPLRPMAREPRAEIESLPSD